MKFTVGVLIFVIICAPLLMMSAESKSQAERIKERLEVVESLMSHQGERIITLEIKSTQSEQFNAALIDAHVRERLLVQEDRMTAILVLLSMIITAVIANLIRGVVAAKTQLAATKEVHTMVNGKVDRLVDEITERLKREGIVREKDSHAAGVVQGIREEMDRK